jgi:DNA-binding MarR family transcriptional regulator
MESRTAAADTDETTGRLADQLLWLTRRLHKAQRRHMEPLGVTPAQARMLRVVAHLLKGESAPRMADLAEWLDVVPRAVTSLTDALEERGLVRRAPDPANRRVVRIELTEAGGDAVRRLRQARRAAAEELLAPLDADQRDALAALLAVLDTAPGRD